MNNKSAALLAAFVSGGTLSQAQILNPSFEAGGGSLTSWGASGHAFATTTALFPTPTQSTHEAVVATDLDGSFGEPAGTGVSQATAETFLGLTAGSLPGVGNGNVTKISSIDQTVT